MRILSILIDARKQWGGPVQSVSEVVRMQHAAKLAPCVVSLKRPGELGAFEPPGTLLLFEPSAPARFGNSAALIRWLEENARQFDLVVVNEIWSVMIQRAMRTLRRLQVPFIVQPRGSLDPSDLQKKWLLKEILGRLIVGPNLAGAACVLAASKPEGERLNTFGARVPIEVLPHPIAPKVHGDRQAFRDRLGFAPDDFVLLFLSRLDPKKRVELLLAAFEQVAAQLPQARLVVAGGGQPGYVEGIKRRMAQSPFAARMHFAGFIGGAEKQDALAGADLFVLPSNFENFGVAVVEALQAELPVVVSKGVQIWQEVAAAGAGAVFEGGAAPLAELLVEIGQSPPRRREMQTNAAALGQRYTPAKLTDRYLSLWHKYARQPRQSGDATHPRPTDAP